jgi:hypothetical protein
MLVTAFGSEFGRVTVTVLKLNRPELLERRKEKLDALRDRVEVILGTKDMNRKQLLLNALVEDAISHHAEFSACLGAHVQTLQLQGFLPTPVDA